MTETRNWAPINNNFSRQFSTKLYSAIIYKPLKSLSLALIYASAIRESKFLIDHTNFYNFKKHC